MALRPSIAVLLLIGCVTVDNGPVERGCQYRVLQDQYSAELLFKVRVQEFLGDPDALRGSYPTVYWCREECPSNNHAALVVGSTCYAGQTSWQGHVYVADWGSIHDTAFAHELGHWALIVLYGDGDGAHSYTEWWGMTNEVDREYDERGW